MKVSQKAQQLFFEALTRAGDSRSTFVELRTADDPELRDEVQSLLDAANQADDYFERLSGNVGLAALANDEQALPDNAKVGPWRLLELLGRGGMGSVYLAERADGEYEQRVAVKMLPIGFGSDEARQRFIRERQILAQLKHEHIARLIDGGVTSDGTPYFVMDYVDGVAIDRYCREHSASVRERLRLLLDVARAVQYAHQNLIIHRDLKPGNVLVEPGGRVRLLDFGIAKTLYDDDATRLTRTGLGPMTSRYASPEMLRGEPVTTLADVYALGVLGYELLSGVHPYSDAPDASVPDLWRAITESDPQPASRALAQALNESPAHSIVRPAELRGDLDLIVAKAMRKDPQRRYDSVVALIDDIERHLDNQPVQAQPPRLSYRVGKFVRRNTLLVAACVAGIVFVGTALYQSRQLAAESTRANREAYVAGQISDFLVALFETPDPERTPGETPTVRDVLEQGARLVSTGTIDDPEIRGRLLNTMGQTYERLGQFDEGEALLTEARDLLTDALGATHPRTLATRTRLGIVYLKQGRYAEARAVLAPTLDAQREALGEHDPATLDTQQNLAIAYAQLGDFVGAASLVERMASHLRAEHGLEHVKTINAIHNLAVMTRMQGRMDEAEALYLEILEPQQRIVGEDHPNSIGLLQNLADLYKNQGRYEDAEPLYVKAVDIAHRVLGEDHLNALRINTNFANLHVRLGNFALAEQRYESTLARMRASVGSSHPETLNTIFNLGRLHAEQDESAEAIVLLMEASEGFSTRLGADHVKTRQAELLLSRVLARSGDAASARALAEPTIRWYEQQASRADATLEQKIEAARAYLDAEPPDLRDPERALQLCRQANALADGADPSILLDLARAEADAGYADAADETMQEAIQRLHPGASVLRERYRAYASEIQTGRLRFDSRD